MMMQLSKNALLLVAFTIVIWGSFSVVCSHSFIVIPNDVYPQFTVSPSSIRSKTTRTTVSSLNAENNNGGGSNNDWLENLKSFWQGGSNSSSDNNEPSDGSTNQDLAAGTSRILTIPGMYYTIEN